MTKQITRSSYGEASKARTDALATGATCSNLYPVGGMSDHDWPLRYGFTVEVAA